jgi:Zn ribbon nucleic-acid-binding protein
MRVRHYALGKFYTSQCPEGTEFVRRSGSDDFLVVPLNGGMIRIPADPPTLLPMLAGSGNFGVMLVGEQEPEMRLAGLSCPECREMDVAWLQVLDDSESVRCDRCGTEFGLPDRHVVPSSIVNPSAD